MKDDEIKRWSTYESFFIEMQDKRIAEIIVTNHAFTRWQERVDRDRQSPDEIVAYIWECLKQNRITPYHNSETDNDVFVIDNDLVLVAECSESEIARDLIGQPLHKWIIVTFLGRMSETLELRDLKSYYSWLRHTRRMTLFKNNRKKK